MKTPLPLPPQVVLRELLDYNPTTGSFFWKQTGKGKNVNCPAGSVNPSGYRYIVIKQVHYLAHRLAWMWMNNADPGGMMLDHKNQNTDDNRIENLRLAQHGENQKNARTAKNNTSGFKGLVWIESRKRWSGMVYHQNKRFRTPDFQIKEDAIQATRDLRERLHGLFANHG